MAVPHLGANMTTATSSADSPGSASWRRRPLGVNFSTTVADFRAKPDCLFSADDIAAAGIVGSRSGLRRAIQGGKFPRPIRLPSGRLAWRGAVIAEWLDGLEEGYDHA